MRIPCLLFVLFVSGCAAPKVVGKGGAGDRKAEEGLASFYASSLEGRKTASGEPYRGGEATCAHKSHRFGTRLRVTRVDGGKSVICRVNDRGPFVKGRVVDLSRSLAEQIGMIQSGVVRVLVERLE